MRRLAIAVAALVLADGLPRAALAMPVFAEAYGYDCTKCHIQVPALNSYGRYVQRSMYAALDRQTLAALPPVWVGESANYDTQAPFEPHHVQFGNLAVHLSGFISNDLTTHIQQWLALGDEPGPLDTAWVSYDRIFGPNTHLVVGKMPPPGPSFFSQWMDLASFAVPQITVGEHSQELQSNRWGAKAGWTNENFTADAGWFASGEDLNGATDFSGANDKAVQWHVAYAPAAHPVQLGLYGNGGTSPLAEGGVDRHGSTGAYLQVDATGRAPGVLLIYQRGWDGNAGQGQGPATSDGTSAELFWKPLRRYEGLLSVREELQSDGLGNVTHTSNLDVNFRVARFVHATLEGYAQSNGKPGVRYQVWWTTPLERVR